MDSKKLEILEKATAVFLKFGIKSVTMDDMSRELGISKKTLYSHFKDKNDLVNQIIQLKIDYDQSQCMCVKVDAENAIDELFMINGYVTAMMKNIHPSVFYDLRKFHPEAMDSLHKHKWQFVKNTILENIRRGKTEGVYRNDLPDEITARVYVGATDMVSNGETFADIDKTADQIFSEIILFQIYGMINEKGLKYLNEKLPKYIK